MSRTQSIPNELKVLHDQVKHCQIKGLNFLAEALQTMLNRQVRELGLAGEWTRFLAENETSQNPVRK